MELFALSLLGVFAAVCVGGRTWLHWRRTGRLPIRLRSGVEAVLALVVWGGALSVGAITEGTGTSAPLVRDDALVVVGTLLALAGIGLTWWSQLAMGESWRIGIDTGERTRLVTEGPYRRVRNPIYTGMVLFALGLCALIPNLASFLAVGVAVGTMYLFVRRVEEPHLKAVHGVAYAVWATSTGRFLPGIGALR